MLLDLVFILFFFCQKIPIHVLIKMGVVMLLGLHIFSKLIILLLFLCLLELRNDWEHILHGCIIQIWMRNQNYQCWRSAKIRKISLRHILFPLFRFVNIIVSRGETLSIIVFCYFTINQHYIENHLLYKSFIYLCQSHFLLKFLRSRAVIV